MPPPIKLSKSDARRALIRQHFALSPTVEHVFDRLGSVQFDPIAPVGCNHDLVLHARTPGYQIGDWEKLAYEDRFIYDGWDKQASLVPFSGWPWRRIFHSLHAPKFEELFAEHRALADSILKEIETKGPLMPKDSEFQTERIKPKTSWHTTNLTKRVLRALWHTGHVMTSGRKNGQHLYDLTERVVPAPFLAEPAMSDEDAILELVYQRHRAVGVLRLAAPYEVWSYAVYAGPRAAAAKTLVDQGRLVPVDLEGVVAHATPEFLTLLDQPALDPRVVFVAPLDQILWDRKMINHLFGFDYVWEIYTPEAKRRWGYYILPVMYGDTLVARAEFWARDGILEVRRWHEEASVPADALVQGLRGLMAYSRTSAIRFLEGPSSLASELGSE